MPNDDKFQDLPADKYPRAYSERMKKILQDVEINRGGPWPANTDVNPQGAESVLQQRSSARLATRKTAQTLADRISNITKGKARVSVEEQ